MKIEEVIVDAKNYETAHRKAVQNNIRFICGLIEQEKSNYEIIDSIEKILEIVSDNKSAQLHTLWKILLFLSDVQGQYYKQGMAIHNFKKSLGLNAFNDDLYEEKEQLHKMESLKVVGHWITNLYAQIKKVEDDKKNDTVNYSEKVQEGQYLKQTLLELYKKDEIAKCFSTLEENQIISNELTQIQSQWNHLKRLKTTGQIKISLSPEENRIRSALLDLINEIH